MNTYNYNNQVAIVTGGANGIGAAIAERIVNSGGLAVVWDLDIADPEPRIANLDDERCKLIKTDVSDFQSVEAAAAVTKELFEKVDVLINSAGIAGPTHSLVDYPIDAWRKVQAINLDGTFHTCKAIAPGMVERNYGRIVNIASIAGKEGNPMASAYSASKAAVIGLTKSLAKELAGYNIAVNSITPATAQTRILEQLNEEFIEYMRSKIPRDRFVTVEEVASMVMFIASSENSFTTGAAFDLSGGRATY
ncbi:MAG: SDR family NAD(P)-dependent oxidoreductase [Pseudomonadota bacterium]